ncbi:hypothetical protein [Fodinibius sp.]|uniref:hypothetical protein n=1 Tax=Fodinibius sp. TaxID=1872440 RepID=UPI003567BC49
MTEMFEQIKILFLGLGEQYGVNPVIFGSIYIGAIPFFTLSVAWLIRNYREDKSIILPAFAATGCFISAYIYLMIVGRNVPWWVYAAVVAMVGYGAWSAFHTIRRKMNRIDNITSTDEE